MAINGMNWTLNGLCSAGSDPIHDDDDDRTHNNHSLNQRNGVRHVLCWPFFQETHKYDSIEFKFRRLTKLIKSGRFAHVKRIKCSMKSVRCKDEIKRRKLSLSLLFSVSLSIFPHTHIHSVSILTGIFCWLFIWNSWAFTRKKRRSHRDNQVFSFHSFVFSFAHVLRHKCQCPETFEMWAECCFRKKNFKKKLQLTTQIQSSNDEIGLYSVTKTETKKRQTIKQYSAWARKSQQLTPNVDSSAPYSHGIINKWKRLFGYLTNLWDVRVDS